MVHTPVSHSTKMLLWLWRFVTILVLLPSRPHGVFSFSQSTSSSRSPPTTASRGDGPPPSPPSLPTPITDPRKFPAQQHCSRCGLCETSYVVNVTDACAFLPTLGMVRLDAWETTIHGRSRHPFDDDDVDSDEARFGVLHRPIQLVKGRRRPLLPPPHDDDVNVQWTGVVTAIATAMLEAGEVDAVACIASVETTTPTSSEDAVDDKKKKTNTDNNTNSSNSSNYDNLIPRPILARTVADVYRARGVKPCLAPSLTVLDELRHADPPIRKLLFCGVGCAVQAFRTIQTDLALDAVYVLGTNCADNSPSPEAAVQFLEQGVQIPSASTVAGYEFMQDYRVHVKPKKDGGGDSSYVKRPYFSLPGAIAETAIAKSCLTCMDYTNGLADVVVGYMGAPLTGTMDQSYQTVTVRNPRGAFMVDIAQHKLDISPTDAGRSGRFGGLVGATLEADALVGHMLGNAPQPYGMPVWLGDLLATVLTQTGPKGLNFAKYSIDYHIMRNYLYILHQSKSKQDVSVPSFSKSIIDHYLSTNQNIARLEELILARKLV